MSIQPIGRLQTLCCLPQNVVAGSVAKGVVQVFELIQIEHDHGQGICALVGSTDLAVQNVFKCIAIEQSGQRIDGFGQGDIVAQCQQFRDVR